MLAISPAETYHYQEYYMRKIVSCIDFSPLTDKVMAETRKLAKTCPVQVMLIYVTGDRPSQPSSVVHNKGNEEEGIQRRKDIRKLMNLKEDLEAEDIPCEISTPSGPVSQAIAREASEFGADYILMGSHGNGAMYHLVVGSVAEGVLKATGKPVILVPADPEHGDS